MVRESSFDPREDNNWPPPTDATIAQTIEKIAADAWAATQKQSPSNQTLQFAKREALHRFKLLDKETRKSVEQYFVSTRWYPLIKHARLNTTNTAKISQPQDS
jgi:hypothetical protein